MKPSKRVVTKSPSNSSTASGMKSGKSYTQSPQPVAGNLKPVKPTPLPKEKKTRATQVGYSSKNPKATKKLNPSAKQTMRRPGLVTSKASGG